MAASKSGKLKRMSRRNTSKKKCPLWWGDEDVKTCITGLFRHYNWGTKFLNDKWLNMNKETAYTKIYRWTKKLK